MERGTDDPPHSPQLVLTKSGRHDVTALERAPEITSGVRQAGWNDGKGFLMADRMLSQDETESLFAFNLRGSDVGYAAYN